jgi:Protein of unknown function (DUF1257)
LVGDACQPFWRLIEFDRDFKMDDLIKFLLKPRRLSFNNDIDDFSILRTQITDLDVLITALQELEFLVKIGAEVRGYYSDKHANLVAVLEGDCDLGWVENTNNSDGTFDLILDLWGVSKYHKFEPLIATINQKYHELKIRKDELS